MKYNYLLMCLIVSMVNINIFGTDFASDQMADESPVEQDSLLNKGSSGRVMACSCEQCVQQVHVIPNNNVTPQLNLYDVAYEILNEVLQFDLKTANSTAANKEHNNIHMAMRKKTPVPLCYGEDGNAYYFLDEIYKRSKSSIEHGVATCVEYAQIGAIIFFEKMYFCSDKLRFKYVRGENFDHEYIAIGRLNEDLSSWLVIDPWLRKVFPWRETVEHLKRAGVNPFFGSEYKYKVVTIADRHGNYHPANYTLKTVKKLMEDKRRSIWLALDKDMYNVPYESQQKCYDPETRTMIIGSKIRLRISKKQHN